MYHCRYGGTRDWYWYRRRYTRKVDVRNEVYVYCCYCIRILVVSTSQILLDKTVHTVTVVVHTCVYTRVRTPVLLPLYHISAVLSAVLPWGKVHTCRPSYFVLASVVLVWTKGNCCATTEAGATTSAVANEEIDAPLLITFIFPAKF